MVECRGEGGKTLGLFGRVARDHQQDVAGVLGLERGPEPGQVVHEPFGRHPQQPRCRPGLGVLPDPRIDAWC
jgi:hypothetical protein